MVDLLHRVVLHRIVSHRMVLVALVATVGVFVGCSYARKPLAEPGDMGVEAEEAKPPVLVGAVSRDDVEMAVPDWVQAEIEAEVDPDAALTLANVDPGAEVTVYLGSWCGDSKRELSHLWRAFDEAGGLVNFELRYIAVDRDKAQPEELIAGADLAYVPTFIVRRGGEEVGRIVEEAPGGIVHDLTALLTGEATGVISAREDLEPEPPGSQTGEPQGSQTDVPGSR